MEQIIVDISPTTGLPTVTSKGFVGKSCLEATQPITDALGTITEDQPTAEMNRLPPQKQTIKQ